MSHQSTTPHPAASSAVHNTPSSASTQHTTAQHAAASHTTAAPHTAAPVTAPHTSASAALEGRGNDCYFITAAALLGVTVDQLHDRTELMVDARGGNGASMDELFTAVRANMNRNWGGTLLPNGSNIGDAKSFIDEAPHHSYNGHYGIIYWTQLHFVQKDKADKIDKNFAKSGKEGWGENPPKHVVVMTGYTGYGSEPKFYDFQRGGIDVTHELEGRMIAGVFWFY
jgi:hypothetical protein